MATDKQNISKNMKISKDRHSFDGQRLKTILKLGCANDNNLLNDIILYIYLGPDFNIKHSNLYDSCTGQIDQNLLKAEAMKSNWKLRVDPDIMNASEDTIIKNFRESVSLYNSACESFMSEIEIDDLIYKMFIASCFVRDKLYKDRIRLLDVLNEEKFYLRCFPLSKKHLIESEIKLIQNLEISSIVDWEFGTWKLDVPTIKLKEQKLKDNLKILEKYECSFKDVQSKASTNLNWGVLFLILFIIVRTMININNPNTRCKFIILMGIASLLIYTLSFYN